MTAVDRHEVETDWNARGFSCELWIDPPGSRWEDFVHDVDELVLVLVGRMEFEIDGETHRPETGRELLIPAGSVHSARNLGDGTARWLYGYKRR